MCRLCWWWTITLSWLIPPSLATRTTTTAPRFDLERCYRLGIWVRHCQSLLNCWKTRKQIDTNQERNHDTMKRALLLSWLSSETEACARPPVDENSIQLTPSDCTGNSIWSDEERNCACAWGWSGNDCDEWGQFQFLCSISKVHALENTHTQSLKHSLVFNHLDAGFWII